MVETRTYTIFSKEKFYRNKMKNKNNILLLVKKDRLFKNRNIF